jgi:gamma-glutamyltranspeptidase / glutathione hydrolase
MFVVMSIAACAVLMACSTEVADNKSTVVKDTIASKGMVTGTTGAAAQQAGIEILKEGGTAADAAVATAMNQICLAAGSWVSYAGIMNVVYYEASTGKVHNMNASYNTVADETDPGTIAAPDWSKGLLGAELKPDGRSVLVPGFLKGAQALVKRFGKRSLADVVAPSVKCAEEGINWNAGLAYQFGFRKAVLSRDSQTRSVFTQADGSDYKEGDTFKQPALAKTLRVFGEQGADYFYKGPWAKKLVNKVQALGGKLSMEDMAGYEVLWSEPLTAKYHGYDIYVHGFPANGGVNTLEALKLAELAKLSDMGHYSESPAALFWMSNITRVGLALSYLPEQMSEALGFDVSLANRLKPETSEKLWQRVQAGNFYGVKPPKQVAPAHTDGIVVVDQWGNIAAMVHTINTVSWGTTGLNIDGISIPDSAAMQVSAVVATTPGERLGDPTGPGLVMKDGKPFMGYAAISAGLLQRTVSSLISVMDFGMTPQQAINAPAWGTVDITTSDEYRAQEFGVGELSTEMIQAVKDMGMEINENNQTLGYWIGIQIDPETGQLNGGNPRSQAISSGGRAVGY